ncbi:MAG: Crp/Fnr family transcriptional regulator [Caulobacteraceae bacterium]|nr:Crp/Fnr family transcriptional regulator [Caulobacteraceae bacterium]
MVVLTDRATRDGDILARKLGAFVPLSQVERAALADFSREASTIAPAHDLLCQGSGPSPAWVLLEGMACRLIDHGGRRQIVALMLPGDMYGVCAADQRVLDHTIHTLSRCRIARLDRTRLEALAASTPAIHEALRCDERVQEAILRTWLFNLGQMMAPERLAHFLCELAHRLGDLGLVYGTGGFRLPISQEAVGAIIGVTRVQAGRALQRLRSERLIDFHGGVVFVPDFARLAQFAQFDPAYLRP